MTDYPIVTEGAYNKLRVCHVRLGLNLKELRKANFGKPGYLFQLVINICSCFYHPGLTTRKPICHHLNGVHPPYLKCKTVIFYKSLKLIIYIYIYSLYIHTYIISAYS